MHVFVIAGSKDGAPVDEQIVRRFDRLDLPELPFTPDQHMTWSNQSGSIRFAGWQAFAEVGQIGSHWHADLHSLTGFSGLPVWWDGAWPSGKNWSTHLAEEVQASSPAAISDRLIGVFTRYRLLKSGESYVGSDGLSGGLLYTAEIGDTIILSNRASLVARVLSPIDTPSPRDWRGPGWLLYDNQCHGAETGYRGVSVVPPGGFLAIDSAGKALIDRLPEKSRKRVEQRSLSSAADAIDARLRGSLRALAALPFGRREFLLDSGKASRLLLALVLSEGLQDRFIFRTLADRESADGQITKQLADAAGLDLHFDDHPDSGGDLFWESQRIHAALVSGTVSGWTEMSNTVSADIVRVSGSSGLSVDPHPRISLLKPDQEAYFASEQARLVPDHTDLWTDKRGKEPFIGEHRRTIGAAAEISPVPWCDPWLDHALVAIMESIPEEDRFDNRLLLDIMQGTSIGLELLPFTEANWPATASQHLEQPPGFAPPLSVDSGGDRRVDRFRSHRNQIVDYLLDQSHPIYDIADYKQVQLLLETPEPTVDEIETIYSTVTTALWLGKDDHLERIVRSDDPDLTRRQQLIVRPRGTECRPGPTSLDAVGLGSLVGLAPDGGLSHLCVDTAFRGRALSGRCARFSGQTDKETRCHCGYRRLLRRAADRHRGALPGGHTFAID